MLLTSMTSYVKIVGVTSPHRIRIRLPHGAEFEAEGSAEFVHSEARQFLGALNAATAGQGQHEPEQPLKEALGTPNISWEMITELRGKGLQLRAKLRGDKSEKDACLVLLAASQRLLNQPKPTATQLAKWLRSSGYPIVRMDRALQDAVAGGLLLASGSRRSRRYELTAPGKLRAHILANQLTATITGQA